MPVDWRCYVHDVLCSRLVSRSRQRHCNSCDIVGYVSGVSPADLDCEPVQALSFAEPVETRFVQTGLARHLPERSLRRRLPRRNTPYRLDYFAGCFGVPPLPHVPGKSFAPTEGNHRRLRVLFSMKQEKEKRERQKMFSEGEGKKRGRRNNQRKTRPKLTPDPISG